MSHFSEFAKTSKGKLLLAICALLLSWVFLLWQMSGNISSWIPSQERYGQMQKQRKKLQTENTELEKKLKVLKRTKDRYNRKKTEEWVLSRDGNPEFVLPPLITAAAKASELSLNNIGSVKSTRINNDFYYAEVDVSSNAAFENVIRFVKEISKLRPQISWRRFNVNTMMRRNTTTKTTTKKTVKGKKETEIDTTMLNFSGTLRVIVYDGSAVKEEKKK